MLTDKEKRYLEERKHRKAPCGDEMSHCVGCLVRCGCSLTPDWIDAAEFEARVSRYIAENASELDFSSNNWQFFDGFKAKSLAWYILREARIAVEEEMDNGKDA